jgi:hypothetical protein
MHKPDAQHETAAILRGTPPLAHPLHSSLSTEERMTSMKLAGGELGSVAAKTTELRNGWILETEERPLAEKRAADLQDYGSRSLYRASAQSEPPDPRTFASVLGAYGSLDGELQAGLLEEMESQPELLASMSNPALTVEDKIHILLQAVMKKLDKEIQAQGEHIQSLNGGEAKEKNTNVRRGAVEGSPSIDVETSALNRLIQKRSQVFDMLRQIIDKYQQTAKGVTDSIGR